MNNSNMSAKVDGHTVYELDEDGVNRWLFNIQPGYGLDGVRQPDSVLARTAKQMAERYNYHKQLVEALRECNRHMIGEFGINHPVIKYHRELLTELEKGIHNG